MIAQDIRTLLEKLNPLCTKALESSVGSCLTRTNYELTWEHLLVQILDHTDCDVAYILRQYGVDTGRLLKALNKDLDQYPTGNSTKPSFSPVLIGIIERAWSFATLAYNRAEVTSGILFASAMEEMKRSVTNAGAELRAIDQQKLKADLPAIIARSAEQSIPENETKASDPATSEVLKKYCKNFTQDARDGKIDIILGRDNEIRQIIDILSRRRKNNPILVGEAGVGKTAILEGLALRIVKQDVPDTLKDVELWELDLGLLQAGASVKGEFEKRLKAVIETAKNSGGKIILFIDEAHTLIGAGGSEGQGDAANLLKPALARGELRTCAATTWLEYRKYFEKDPALTRRFQMIKVDEPDEKRGFAMLRGVAESYEKHHKVHITDEAIKAAVSYSQRYITGRQLPDKAVDVLDTACTRVKMSRTTTPSQLDRAKRKLEDIERALKTLTKDDTAGIAISHEEIAQLMEDSIVIKKEIAELNGQWEKEKGFVGQILELQKNLLALKPEDARTKEGLKKEIEDKNRELEAVQGNNPMVYPYVTASLCASVIADWTGIPIGSMVKDEAKTLLDMENILAKRIIGQHEAIGQISEVIRSAKSGMADPDAPLGVFLFTGPSGVGKTELALAMADLLFGGEKFTTIINMSEYQEKHTVSQLKGSPPGYVGYGEGGVLTEAVRQKPYSIVILDEVEKAHKDVLNMFYQVFDKGIMRDGQGRDVNFRNNVIVMTSNLGSDAILEACSEERPALNALIEAIRPELTAHFQPALLARFRIIPFYPLEMEVMKSVVILKLAKIISRLKKTHGIDFTYTPELVESIASQCTTVESGARNIDVILGQTLLPSISQTLLSHLGNKDKEVKQVTVSFTEEAGFSVAFD